MIPKKLLIRLPYNHPIKVHRRKMKKMNIYWNQFYIVRNGMVIAMFNEN